MYAVLLNPPRRKRRKRRLSKACRSYIAKRASRRRLAKKGQKRRKIQGRGRVTHRSFRRRGATKADPMGLLPRAYAANRSKRRRRRNRSTYLPAFESADGNGNGNGETSENPRRKRRRRRNRSTYVPAYEIDSDNGNGNGNGTSTNPRRRRRGRRRNRLASYGYGRRFRRNPAWVPSYAMNPGVMSAARQVYSPKYLIGFLPAVGGAVANRMLSGAVLKMLPSRFQTGLSSIGVSLLTAVGVGIGGSFLPTRNGGKIAFGAVVDALYRGAQEYLLPALGLSGCGAYGCMGDYAHSMLTSSYLPDYSQVTGINNVGVPSFAQASGLNPYPYGMQGMAAYLTRQDAAEARPLGDYLTVENAATARPLGMLSMGDSVVASELAGA